MWLLWSKDSLVLCMAGPLHNSIIHTNYRWNYILGNYNWYSIFKFDIILKTSKHSEMIQKWLFSLIVQVFFCGKDEFLEDIGFVMFAFFNVIWATLYLESWKRRSAELAFEWGTSDQRPGLLSEPRPLYKVNSCTKQTLHFQHV